MNSEITFRVRTGLCLHSFLTLAETRKGTLGSQKELLYFGFPPPVTQTFRESSTKQELVPTLRRKEGAGGGRKDDRFPTEGPPKVHPRV